MSEISGLLRLQHTSRTITVGSDLAETVCRQASAPGFQLKCRGGLMAAEAVALLKDFYATGNPKGVLYLGIYAHVKFSPAVLLHVEQYGY